MPQTTLTINVTGNFLERCKAAAVAEDRTLEVGVAEAVRAWVLRVESATGGAARGKKSTGGRLNDRTRSALGDTAGTTGGASRAVPAAQEPTPAVQGDVLADVDRLLGTYRRLELDDALSERTVAGALHAELSRRAGAADRQPFYELPHVRQHAYLHAATVALRLLSPAWVAMAQEIAVAEGDPETAIRTFLFVLEGLHGLSTRERLALARRAEAEATPWHRVVRTNGGVIRKPP